MNYRYLFPLLALVLSSCIQSERQGLELRFFDLKAFVAEEQERLQQSELRVQKELALDGQTESSELSAAAFAADLELLARADINRAVWRESYRIDSSEEHSLRYLALDPSLETQSIELFFGSDTKLDSLRIEQRSINSLYSQERILEYSPGQQFKFWQKEHILGKSPQEYRVRSRIL